MQSYQVIDSFRVKEILNQRIKFQVPLNHFDKNESTNICVVVNVTQKFDRSLHGDEAKLNTEIVFPSNARVICYVQGGPGFPCYTPLSKSGYTEYLLDKGYQILSLDQRGTGFSTPLDGATFDELVPWLDNESSAEHTQRQLQFVLNFRADSIVEDFEAVRRSLLGSKTQVSLLGQSFGGFCSFTYLSKYPESLREVLVTGGVPPINQTPDDVYAATYARTRERNVHYYTKYPQDIARVKRILQYLDENKVVLPDGGNLSTERFQSLGIKFGGHGGTDSLHQIVLKFDHDLNIFNKPTYNLLLLIQTQHSFDTNILYALFQEAIYCDGNYTNVGASNWSADRLRHATGNDNFIFSKSAAQSEEPVYFTGEMVFKSFFNDFAVLRKFKDLAAALHSYQNWSPLYDVTKLRSVAWDTVPVVGAAYFNDQYVDFESTMKSKKLAFNHNGNLKQYITTEFFHDGIGEDPAKVLSSLFSLLENGDKD